jgi:uncharacterized membrane protein
MAQNGLPRHGVAQNPLPGARARWLKPLLIVSLGVNLAVIGLVLGAYVGGNFPGGGSFAGPRGLRPYIQAMPEDDRAELRQRFEASKKARRRAQAEMNRAWKDVETALLAVPFDADALARAFRNQTESLIGLAKTGQGALLVQITAMSDADRAAYARQLAETPKRRKPKR